MNGKKKITNRTIVLTAVIGSIFVMAMITATTLWSSNQTGIATDEAVSEVSSFYLEAMADRRSKTITNLINSNFDQMEKAVELIKGEEINSQDDLRHNSGIVKSLLNLNRFALVDEDDIVYTQYTTYTGRSRHEFLAVPKYDDPQLFQGLTELNADMNKNVLNSDDFLAYGIMELKNGTLVPAKLPEYKIWL